MVAALPTERVLEARDRYLDANGLSTEQYETRWFNLRLGPLVLHLPNPAQRRATVRHHDLHHVATGFEARMSGEIQISAWECGAGLGGLWIAWLICVPLFLAGFVVLPRRTWRAYRLGRQCRSLFRDVRVYEPLLELSVGELRERIGLPREGAHVAS